MSKSACLSDHELRSLFVLLRSGLWEKDPEDLSLFPLSDAGWLNVYRESVRQTVTGLVYRGGLPLAGQIPASTEAVVQMGGLCG